MSEHTPRRVERHCDVAVIGGSAAGLAAALQLGRQRRSVMVIDNGAPRNAPADHMHSYLGYEGRPPADLTGVGRDEVRSYGGEFLAGRAVDITGERDAFRVEVAGGHVIVARRVVAATGLVDDLPDIDGLAALWGTDVIHCPFCHGFEVRDRRIVQIVTHPMTVHQSPMWRQLTDRLTVVLHDGVAVDPSEVERVRAAGVTVIEQSVSRVEADGGRVSAVVLADGTRLAADAVAIGTRFRVRADAFASLGLTSQPHPTGLGDHIGVDESGATSVPGVYAAGNIADPFHQVLQAAAAGSWVGARIAGELAAADVAAAARPSASAVDWDRRYHGDQMWSGKPNGSLVHEMSEATPGRALDVGAGEGADAIWLAEQGWTVTANDISQVALDRASAEAERRGVHIDTCRADANDLDPFDAGAFDLVCAHYASITRTPDDRAIHNLLDAVTAGGTLLVVSHDLADVPTQLDDSEHSHAFDPDAYVRVDDVAAVLETSPDWKIVTHETRPRPAGHASHHVNDIVLRAERTG